MFFLTSFHPHAICWWVVVQRRGAELCSASCTCLGLDLPIYRQKRAAGISEMSSQGNRQVPLFCPGLCRVVSVDWHGSTLKTLCADAVILTLLFPSMFILSCLRFWSYVQSQLGGFGTLQLTSWLCELQHPIDFIQSHHVQAALLPVASPIISGSLGFLIFKMKCKQ